jgi:hypothetical protein
MTYLYPLQNLTSNIQKQMEAFFAHIGVVPHRLISDFDLTLIGGKAREYLSFDPCKCGTILPSG